MMPASIGGVPLFVSEVDSTVGRRTTSRELPGRDTPAREDLGRSSRRFSVTAHVIGDQYITDRDAVIAVFESPGPWMFVHPWWGEISVILDQGTSLNITESDSQGGWARFSFSLVESGDPDGARVTVSTSAALTAASVATIDAAKVATKKKLKLGIGGVFDAAAGAVGKLSGAMLKAKRKAFGALGVTQAAGLADSLADLNNNITKLLNAPDELLTTLNGLVSAFKGIFKSQAAANADDANAPYPGGQKKVTADAAIATAQALASIDTLSPQVPGVTPDPDEVAAEKALGDFVKVCAVAETIDLFGSLPLESAKSATEALGTLGQLADDILADPDTSDDLFTAMTDLRAALDARLAALAASLPSVQVYTPPATTCALLLAYQLYRDPTRDLEIVGRNDVRDPNFLPGGEPLEILLNG